MKKEKKQKEKNKKNSTNSRKHLTNVRVIQRNLVYVTNIPLNVAKEDVKQLKLLFIVYLFYLLISNLLFLTSFQVPKKTFYSIWQNHQSGS